MVAVPCCAALRWPPHRAAFETGHLPTFWDSGKHTTPTSQRCVHPGCVSANFRPAERGHLLPGYLANNSSCIRFIVHLAQHNETANPHPRVVLALGSNSSTLAVHSRVARLQHRYRTRDQRTHIRSRLDEEGTLPAALPGAPVQQGSAVLACWGGRLLSSFALQQVAIDSSSGSGGSLAASSSPQWQTWRRGWPTSDAPAYDPVQLLRSLGLEGGDPVKLRRSMEALAVVRQEALLQHAAPVLEYLRGLGLPQAKLEQLFVRCPSLFSWPVEERAAKQFHQLMHADGDSGLTVAEAVLCFLKYPPAAKSPEYRFPELAAILAHSADSKTGRKPKVPAVKRTVAALLRQTPSAVQLVCMPEGKLQQKIDRLVAKGCTLAVMAKMVWRLPHCFNLKQADAATKLEQVIDVLGAELGLAAADVLALVGSRAAGWLELSRAALQERAAALAQAFGKEAAASMVSTSPDTLNCPPRVWQCNLHYLAACGVAEPKALLKRNANLSRVDQAAAGFVARRLLLQRYYGHTAKQLYQQHSHYLLLSTANKLAQRLQYVEHCGRLHLLPGSVAAASGCSERAAAAGAQHAGCSRERFLSFWSLLGDCERCLAVLGSSREEWEVFAAGHPEGTGPVWEWAQREAKLEIERLKSALPAELRKAAESQPKKHHKQRIIHT